MRVLLLLVLAVVVALLIAWLAAPVGAWWLHRQDRFAEEITWLENLQPLLPLGGMLDGTITTRRREQVERELRAGRVDRAVAEMRALRRHMRRPGVARDEQVMALGLETYTRAADRVRQHRRLSAAADWLDTLFVFAIRDSSEEVRTAASAAFLEGLDLRVQDGHACAALARWQWAERGLGGTVPDVSPAVEQELEERCARERRGR